MKSEYFVAMTIALIQYFSSETTISMVMLPKLKDKLLKLEEKLTNFNVQIDSVSEMYQFVRISLIMIHLFLSYKTDIRLIYGNW